MIATCINLKTSIVKSISVRRVHKSNRTIQKPMKYTMRLFNPIMTLQFKYHGGVLTHPVDYAYSERFFILFGVLIGPKQVIIAAIELLRAPHLVNMPRIQASREQWCFWCMICLPWIPSFKNQHFNRVFGNTCCRETYQIDRQKYAQPYPVKLQTSSVYLFI